MEQSFFQRIRLLILFLLTIPPIISGQESSTEARDVALGGLQSLSKELMNPAYLSFQPRSSLGVSVYHPFQMKELNTSMLTWILPNKLIDLGIKLSHYGFDDYQFLSFKAGFAKKIHSLISIGSSICYFYETVVEEKTKSEITAAIGLFFHVSEQVNLGILANNMINSYHFISTFSVGIEYRILNSCLIVFEPATDFDTFLDFHLGLEYELGEKLIVRGGIRTQSASPSLGAGYSFGKFNINVGISSHQTLGYSTAASLNCQF